MAQYVARGYMVVPLDVQFTLEEYVDQVAELTPAFKARFRNGRGCTTWAGFGGSPYADHGPKMRALNKAILDALAGTVSSIFQSIYQEEVGYMMVPDRFRHQTPQQRPGVEAPHVDAPMYNTKDMTLVAGYINFGECALVFEMCPGSAIPEATTRFRGRTSTR